MLVRRTTHSLVWNPELLTTGLIGILLGCLLLVGCDSNEEEYVIPHGPILLYFSRDVAVGEKLDLHDVQGRAVTEAEYKKNPEALSEFQLFRFEGRAFTRSGLRDEVVTRGHFRPIEESPPISSD